MALKRLKVKLAAPAPTETGDSIPVIAIEGDLIKQYNDADRTEKDAKGLKDGLRPEVLELALTEIYTRSIKRPMTPTPTVKLQDDEKETLMVCFVNRYGECGDVPAAEELFDLHDVDINGYVTEGVKATFDDKVFYDAEGNFQQDIYDDIRKAIQTVVTRRQLAKNPLETSKVIRPKPCFHDERWTIFPKLESQQRAFELLPNMVTVKPVRTDKSPSKRK